MSNDVTDNTSEPGIAGVTLTLQRDGGSGSYSNYTPPGAGGPTTVTDSSGNYSFGNLPAGTYRVAETQPTTYSDGKQYQGGVEVSTPSNDVLQVTLAANATSSGNIFGERGTAISGTVFWDQNANGANDTEPGINGVTVQLQDSSGVPIDLDPNTAGVQSTVLTGTNGTYSFPNLPAGDYRVVETQPSGYGSSTPNSVTVTLVAGTPGSASFGDTLSTLSGRVYDDVNNNALFDVVGDTGISGVTLALFASNGTTAISNPVTNGNITTTTASDGTYTLVGIPAGTGYMLKETQPTGYFTRASNPGTGGTPVGTGNTTAGNDLTNEISGIGLPRTGATPPGSPLGINYNFGERIYADLSLLKTVAPRNAQPDNPVTFTLTVTNLGPSATAGVVVTDVVPAGYITLAESDANASFTGTGGNTLIWNVGTLTASGAGATKTLTFTAVVALTPAVGTLRNLAEITASGQPDPDSTPGNAGTPLLEDDTGIAEPGGIVLQKLQRNLGPANSTNPVPALSVATIVGKPSDVVEYCINATNLNSRLINGINLSDVVPANTTYVTTSGGTFNVNKVDFTPFNLTSGASQQNCFKVTIN